MTDATERLHGLDALRGGMLMLGVALHASMSFMPIQVWVVQDTQPSAALTVFFYAVHIFRMVVFFLIAGFFARLALHRRGTGGFIADRLKRIAAPLLVFWPLVMTGMIAVLIWIGSRMAAANGGVAPPAPPPPTFTPDNFPLGHLWFLWVLLIFYAALVIGRSLMVAVDRQGGLRRAFDRPARLILGFAAPLLLAAPLAVALFYQPNWLPFFGVPTPDMALIPHLSSVVAYGVAFAAGYGLHRQPELLNGVAARWPLNLTLGAICAVVGLMLLGPSLPAITPVEEPVQKAMLAGLYAVASYGISFGLLGFALRRLSNRSALRRYIADASYWVYLIHIPIVMALQVAIADLAWPWPFKFAALLAGVFAITFGTYQILVRHSFIGTWLNGMRARNERRAARAELVPAQ
ncbi:hypothetical protein ASG17_04295 [Brevundimonas sp. Leaf363]|uniref:acyltransferase family protein n=1 Tax=Brevundimonas sp. Leaf363 TaxID=1736353 RepID=UPI000702130C|nr:acyltransferase family protein [Brevundimonas sp. Leaf363]KQS55319.1 hypothetical protein ASG17_04295 [Brevundimonas sp. Leaf363]